MTIINPIPVYPIGFQPVTPVTPFTYRDGATYLDILESLKHYIRDVLVPWIDLELDTSQGDIQGIINDLIEQFNAAVTAMLNGAPLFNDPIATALFNDTESDFREALDSVYATITALTTTNENVDSLATDLSAAHLEIETLNALVDTGRLSVVAITDEFTQPVAATLYVDPRKGSDTNSGLTWGDSFATIQAAVNAIPTNGSEIVLADTNHDVGSGVVWPREKWPSTLRGATMIKSRQHADGTRRQARITSTATTKPTSYIEVLSGSSNLYGGNITDIYIDGDNLADNGFAFIGHALNRVVIERISGRALNAKEGANTVFMFDSVGGNDASWITFRDCATYGMNFLDARNSNYVDIDGSNSFMGRTSVPRVPGPAIKIKGSQDQIRAHIEGWDVGIYAYDSRGPVIHSTSEWTSTLVSLDNCYDGIIFANSAAGSGNSEVLDNNGRNNMVIGTAHRKTGTTTQAHSFGARGHSLMQLDGGSAYTVYGAHPTRPATGIEVLPDVTDLLSLNVTLAIDYWDGSAWTPWVTDPLPAILPIANDQGISVDFTHKRFRIRSGSLINGGEGFAYTRLVQPNGSASTVTFRLLKTDLTTLQEYSTTIDEPAQSRGAWASFGLASGGDRFEIEINFNISEGQTATIRRLHLWGTDVSANLRGREYRGNANPNGLVNGRVGDVYHCTNISVALAGWWVKSTDGANTGWRRMAPLLETLPALGAAATDVATTQTLANNIRTALISAGWATA